MSCDNYRKKSDAEAVSRFKSGREFVESLSAVQRIAFIKLIKIADVKNVCIPFLFK